MVALAVCAFLVLGFSNLGAPSLWHDELVHVYVAKGIAETGRPVLPGGATYTNYLAYNTLLSGWIAIFGDSEAAVRSLSVLIGAAALVVMYMLGRGAMGGGPAAVAVAVLALSPWYLAWARQGRFYMLQLALYLVFLGLAWRASTARTSRTAAGWTGGAVGVYLLGVMTSLHSILFVTAPGVMALRDFLFDARNRRRHFAVGVFWAVMGLATLVGYKYLLSAIDQSVIFTFVGFDMIGSDADRADRWYYFRWLMLNHSIGYFVLAMVGSALIALKWKRPGLFWVVAFWVPILVLNFYVGYKRPRFMFFLFPLYIGAASYGLMAMLGYIRRRDRTWLHVSICVVLAILILKCGISAFRLTRDSVEVAAGADLTLAKLHPRWREAGAYVREHATDADSILASSFLPVHHYAGRADSWYPSRFIPGETQESGMNGLRTLEELRGWLASHPRGYYVADTWQFDRLREWPRFAEEYAWVAAHMEYVTEGSSESVSVWRWTPETLENIQVLEE